jgi:hypothetical protein
LPTRTPSRFVVSTEFLKPILEMDFAFCHSNADQRIHKPPPVSVPSLGFMAKNLTMKTFSNFNSATVRDKAKLREALEYLHTQIADQLFRTKIEKTFRLDQIREAMAYETQPGAKAVLLAKDEM